MPRPKSDDPKLQVNLRLPESIIQIWQVEYPTDWRAQMEALLASLPHGEDMEPAAPRPRQIPKAARKAPDGYVPGPGVTAKLDTSMVPTMDRGAMRQRVLDQQKGKRGK